MNLNLNEKLKHIGIRIDYKGAKNRRVKTLKKVDIEETLIEAARSVPEDSKLFSLLCSWIKVHGDYVHISKLLKKIAKLEKDDLARTWIPALCIFAQTEGFHKWSSGSKKSPHPAYLYNEKVSKSAIRLKGSDPSFKKYNFYIPVGSIRIREDDALTPQELAVQNLQYKNRLLFGASWRADIITAIQHGATSPYSISRNIGCSYEPAHRIYNEYKIASGL